MNQSLRQTRTRMTYKNEGRCFDFILDLSNKDDAEKLIRTARWASLVGVSVQLESVRTIMTIDTAAS